MKRIALAAATATAALSACAEKPVTTEDAVPDVKDDGLATAYYSSCSECTNAQMQLEWMTQAMMSAYLSCGGGSNPECLKYLYKYMELSSQYIDCSYECGGGGGGGGGGGSAGGNNPAIALSGASNYKYPTSGYAQPVFRSGASVTNNGFTVNATVNSGWVSINYQSGSGFRKGGICLLKRRSTGPTSCNTDLDCQPPWSRLDINDPSVDRYYYYCMQDHKCYAKVFDSYGNENCNYGPIAASGFGGPPPAMPQITAAWAPTSSGYYAGVACVNGPPNNTELTYTYKSTSIANWQAAPNGCAVGPEYASRAQVLFTW